MPQPTVHIEPLSALTPDTDNANAGTERGAGMLARSLREYGAGRSVLVDREGRLIAGNKTASAAVGAGIERVIVVETTGDTLVAVKRLDLDLTADPKARALAYADNRVGEVNLAWDTEALAASLEAGVDLSPFWNDHELELLFEQAVVTDSANEVDELPETLPGALALKPDMQFESEEVYDIPPLLPDKLADLPDDLDVWAGADASEVEREGWWLYCYGSDSMRGLDLTRTVLAFYVEDVRFERWYTEPARYTAKALNGGIQTVIAPNFSLWYGLPPRRLPVRACWLVCAGSWAGWRVGLSAANAHRG